MPLRIGHRGAAGHAPENTCAAIKTGISLRVDYVELDVQVTKDGKLVIMHDKRVERTTNGRGYVARMTLDEIRKLDAGNGERVPTVQEVLELAQGRVGLMLEIISPGIAEQLCTQVREGGFTGSVIYASFLHAELLRVHALDPVAKTLALLEGAPVTPAAFAIDAQATHVGLGLDSILSDQVEALRSAGTRVFVYTVNHPEDIDAVKRLGVDGIISDFPERI